MTTRFLDGKALAETIRNETRSQIEKLSLQPSLAVILVGNDPASERYVSLKQRASREVGIMVSVYRFEESTDEKTILETINWLNADDEIDAILVQLPLPAHLNEHAIVQAVSPAKDVDGFHPENIKKLLRGQPVLTPGLHLGIMQLLAATGETLAGKHAAIVAKSPEFTGTLSYILSAFGVANDVVRPDDPRAREVMRNADIIIVAAGKTQFVTGDAITTGAIIIDVGTTLLPDGTVAGDVDVQSCKEKAAWISPVPGGVGPMTVAMLLKNTVLLATKNT